MSLYMNEKNNLIVRYGKRERTILAGKWFIDRNTPVGEDADIYEIKPFGGKRFIPLNKVLRTETPS